MLDNITALGNPEITAGDPTMPDTDSHEPPDPPWFAKPNHPDIPCVEATNTKGHTVELPYIRYALIDEEPMLLGTTGKGEAVYGEYL